MSPEQIKDSKNVDGRADLWSVGIIFYEILTGSSPFPADNEFARLTAVLTEEVTPIEQVAPHYASWGPFFQRALAKDPAYRFQSADEMAAALVHSARGPSLRPPPTLQAAQPQPDWRNPQERRSVTPAPGVSQTAAMPVIAERPSASGTLPVHVGGDPRTPATGVSGALPSMPTPAMSVPVMMSSAPGAPGSSYPPVQQPVAALAATQVAPALSQGQSGLIPSPALSRGSTPPPRYDGDFAPKPRGSTIASTPPPDLPSHVVGSGVSVGPTHVSAQAPAGTPAYRPATPSIEVVDPPPRPAGMAPYWVVGLVAFVAFGLGLALGILITTIG
jgi:serine/threonine-protein kinase